MKRNLLVLFMLLCNFFLFAQAPTISYSGVQSSYTVNNAMSPLTPTLGGGSPIVRTNVSTIAGSGTSGFSDGTTASPKFYSPTGITVAASGNLYIADSQNHCIRKITASGFVTTFAGSGVPGFLNGAADVAQFNAPFAVAVDASENVYVTESNSYSIRKITQAGVVSTLAGKESVSGYADGQGANASFASPKGMDVDASGNIYVADAGNNRIRKITSSGTVTTVAGDGSPAYLDGQGTAAKFNNPIGIAIATSGTIYVTDASNNRVRVISASGTVTTIAGSGASGMVNGQGTAAQFNGPRAITVDGSGNLYVVDYNNNRIRKISSGGAVTTLSGTGAFGAVNGAGTVATFKYPEGVGVDASGNVFVADVTNNTIRKITSTGDTSTYAGSATRGLENGQTGAMAMFNSPVAVVVTSSGITYVIDDFNSCIRKVTANGIVSTFVGNTTTGYADGSGTAAYFNNPKGMAIDAAGNIYIADTFNNRIRKVTSAGVVTTIAGDGTAGYLDGQGTAAKFNNPYGLTVDNAGNIYVADTKNHRIRKISTSGAVTTVAGYILSGFADGASTTARFKNPQGIVIDPTTGILYVADTTNNRIRKIATDGTVSTFAGSFAGYQDDQGTAAYFNNPIGITRDSAGNLYIGDYYNSVIRKVDPTGLVSTYAGSGSSEYNDGIGNVASFYFPVGVTTDASGNVYVADSYTQRIRKITSVEPYTISPALPTGMAFNSSTGVISGTPTEVRATMTYTIAASNYTGTGTTTIAFATGTGSSTAAPSATAQSFCSGADVADLVATGTALKWYNVSTGGTALASTTALTTATYYVSQTINSIESSRTSVAVTINNTSAPSATAQTFCGSASVANLTAIGTALKWYNVSTGGTALSSTVALSSGIYYVSQTLNSCESSRTAVTVTVNTTAAPTASAQTFCSTATVANLVATGTALKWYNVSTGGSALASTTTLTAGTYYVSQTLNSCESPRTAVTITINATAAPTATAQTFNSGADVADLVATGTNLQWYTSSSGGTALATNAILSTGTYYVSQTLSGCESTRTAVSVTINTAPGAPTASAQTFCSGADVADLVATGTALKWYNVSTGGTALASTTVLTTATYYVSQTVNSIESSRTSVAVTVNNTSAPSATAQTFCGVSSVANLTATGTSLKWYNVSTGGTALSSTAGLSSGTYYVSQTLNSCESSRTAVTITVNNTAAPTASAQAFCGSASVANLVATGTSLKWYNVSTGGTALSSTVALSSGTYYVSQTLNSCESSRTAVTVTVNNTAAPTASAQAFCGSASVANLTATGTALKWYNVSTGGTALSSTVALSSGTYYVSQTLNSCESARTSVAVTVNNTSAPSASAQTFNSGADVSDLVASGTNLQWYTAATGGSALASTTILSSGTYYVSQTLNSCESSRTAVSVTINTAPGAPTASAQSFCNSATVANLVASGTNLQWYNVAAGGSALVSTTALTSATYYVSQTVNSLESARTAVSVTINVTPIPTASAQAFCNAASVANLVATGTALKWYNVSTGGTALSSTVALSSGTYYVSQTLNSCESSRTSVTVTINTTSAPTASAQTFNSGADVGDLVASGTNLQWYSTSTGGSALASTTILSTGTYYVSQTLNSCESTRTAVSIIINTAPGAPTASAQSFCSGADVSDLVATGTNLRWYTTATGGSALASTTILSTGTYYVSQTVNSIESTRTAVTVTINTAPAPTASAQTFNSGADVSDLVATGTNLQWYTAATGGTALASTIILSTGTYYVSQTLNSCESARTAVSVTINVAPGAPTASAQSFCNSATVANLVATGTNLQWYAAATGGMALASTASLSTGTYYVSQTVNSVESSRTAASVTINVTPAPTASFQTFCIGATVANLVATGTNLKWYTVTTGGNALPTTFNLVNGNFYVSQTVNSCESGRTLVIVSVSNPTAPTASAQTFCDSATVADLAANGTNLKWYTVATGGTALATTTDLSTGTYYVSQTPSTCESSRTAVSITVNVTPAPTASAQNFSSGADVSDLVASGTNLQWYTTAAGGNALASTTVLSTGTYYVSQTLNSCESLRTAVSVTINTAPGAPTASAQTFCNSSTVANLVATGTNLQWYTSATGGTALASTTALASATYYVSQTVNSIESTRTAVSVTINTTPAPTASSQTFCNGATVANLVASGTNLKWYTVTTGGTPLASTFNLVNGNFYVSQTVNFCESPRTLVIVTVNTTPPPTASPQSFCGLAMISNLVATGTNLKWYNNVTGGNALVPSAGLVTGFFYVSQTLNSCESTRVQVAVTVNATPVPTASAQAFSNGADVGDLVATGTNLQWYSTATGGSALSSTMILVSGNYYVSQTINSCESARTLVAVTINTVTGAPIASPQSFCNSAVVANLVATGTNLKWYNAATGGTALASTAALATGTYYVSQTINSVESARTAVSVTINVTPAPTASSQTFASGADVGDLAATGTNLQWYTTTTGGIVLSSTTLLVSGNYYVTQTINSCESARTLVIVTINTATGAPMASPQSFCNSATVANLVATGTNLKWYNVATGGTALATTVALSTATYYVSQTINSVESARTAVSVTINVTPAPTASSQTFCSGATVANLVANGTNLKWYTVTTGGTALASSFGLVTGNFYVTQTVNSCESARTMVILTVYNTAVPTASAQTFNSGATVANLVATGTALKWYNVATGGTALASTAVLATGTYYVSQTLNSCESTRRAVSVTINTVLTAPAASDQSFCTASTVSNLVATGTNLKWYTSASGGTALSSNTVLTTRSYYVSQTVNSVESARTQIDVIIYGNPIAKSLNTTTSSGSARSPICISDIKVFTVRSGYSATSITWEKAVLPLNSNATPADADYETIDGASGPTYSVSDAAAGKNFFRAKFVNGDCEANAEYSSPAIVYYRDCGGSSKISAVSYPNPYIETFKISLSSGSEEKIMISIYDMMGKLMEQRETDLTGINELQLGQNYPTGIYNVVVSQEDKTKTLRVVKQ